MYTNEKRHWILPERPYDSYAAYRDATGSDALAHARDLGPEGVVRVLEAAGLRGRGGAGFPTGKKWRSLLESACPQRYVVCNAAEGEPGTFKDRLLLRRNPYVVLEGLLIAAQVLDASIVHVGIKERYEDECAALTRALEEMAEAGAYNPDALEFLLTLGPDAYLLGEENALANVIEGGPPLPRLESEGRPIYEWGIRASANLPNPTLMNNAETFGRVPGIVADGPKSFRLIGTEDTPGPVLYTFSGDVARPGVYEADPSQTFEALVEDLAGGPASEWPLKAALSGVSAGVLTSEHFGRRADFAELERAGSGLGSAGFILLDKSRSMPAVAEEVLRFLSVESCNQCPACKDGLTEAYDQLARRNAGDTDGGNALSRSLLHARSAPTENRCHLPVQGKVLLESLVEAFPEEFEVPRTGAEKAPRPYLIPKLEDYLPDEHRFVLDRQARLKNHDWSWEGPRPSDAPLFDRSTGRTFRV